MTIVIADDSGAARLFTRRCLEVIGFKDAVFVEASNGADALAAVRGQAADLLVTDLHMPIMDGLELIRQLTQGPPPRPRLVVLTSAGNAAKELELAAFGAAVISKPASPAKFAAVLKPKPAGWGKPSP